MFLATILALAGPAPGGADELYRQALARALERAQGELTSSIDLWVDHSRWENPWVAHSEHFEVRTTESYGLAADLARDLEFMRGEWIKLLGEGSGPVGRSPIWIFPALGAYNQFGQPYAEHTSMYGSFYADGDPARPVATYYTANRTQLGMWVTHSGLHQFLEQSFQAQPPTWVSEGLASYFALHWDWEYGARELKRLAASRDFVPFARLLSDEVPAYVSNADDRFIELGMLFHYLLNHDAGGESGEVSASFRDYLRLAVRGEASRSDFPRTLEDDADALEQDLKAFDFAAK